MLSQNSCAYAYSKVIQKTYLHLALDRAHHNLHSCRTMLKGLMDNKIGNIEEQTAIANYLDEKTSKLDQLISNKKAQIDRLKEIRQIEINTAVTKGLDPNVALKPSGIEWLGDIPEHWELWKLSSTYGLYP